jgi:hypothetical protein
MEWSESNDPVGEVVVTFEGIDQDAQDSLDVENFARGVQAPSREDPGGKAYVRTQRTKNRVMTPADIVRFSLALLVALVTWGTLSELGVPDGFIAFGVICAFFVGAAIPSLINLFRAKKAAPVARSVDERFTLRVGPGRFTLAGVQRPDLHVELRSIASFLGDHRLSVALTDGRTMVLPCKLRSKAHAELAQRLNQLVRDARAASSGYRDPV